MEKKKRILISCLMALAVTASSSYAYFTKEDNIAGSDTSTMGIKITNGQISISGSIKDADASTPWVYDVARVSGESLYDGASKKYNDLTEFIKANRSPDITIGGTGPSATNGTQETGESFYRMNIGTKVNGDVTKARPGDAFVLGSFDSSGDFKGGLVIENKSNLRVKVKLVPKDTSAQASLQELLNAGWKLYIDSNPISLSDVTSSGFVIDLGSIAASQVTDAKVIRLELPPTTDDNYENASISTSNGFDINNIFKIVATQENNPGWDKDGK